MERYTYMMAYLLLFLHDGISIIINVDSKAGTRQAVPPFIALRLTLYSLLRKPVILVDIFLQIRASLLVILLDHG